MPPTEVIDPPKKSQKLFERSGDPNDPIDVVIDAFETEMAKGLDQADSGLRQKLKTIIDETIDARRKLWQAEANNGSVPGSNETHNGKKYNLATLSKGLRHKRPEKYCPLEWDMHREAAKTMPSEEKFLQSTDDESAGALVPMEIAAGIIEEFRPAVVAFDLGCRQISVTGDPYKALREKAHVDPDWNAQGALIGISPDLALDWVEMKPRKLSTIVEVTDEQLIDAGATDRLIRAQIAREFPIKLDGGILLGDGAGQNPVGILNTAGLGSVTFSGAANVGTRYDQFKLMQRTLRRLDVPENNAKWCFHPDVLHDLEIMNDITLRQLERKMLTADTLKNLFGRPFRTSTQMPVAGNAVLYGDFTTVWVPQWGAMTIRVSEHARFREDIWQIKPRMRRDVGVMRPEAFVASASYTSTT